jgi:hypothetical protein
VYEPKETHARIHNIQHPRVVTRVVAMKALAGSERRLCVASVTTWCGVSPRCKDGDGVCELACRLSTLHVASEVCAHAFIFLCVHIPYYVLAWLLTGSKTSSVAIALVISPPSIILANILYIPFPHRQTRCCIMTQRKYYSLCTFYHQTMCLLTGSKMSLMAMALVSRPTTSPPRGIVHALSHSSHATICTSPSRKPTHRPLLTRKGNSARPHF